MTYSLVNNGTQWTWKACVYDALAWIMSKHKWSSVGLGKNHQFSRKESNSKRRENQFKTEKSSLFCKRSIQTETERCFLVLLVVAVAFGRRGKFYMEVVFVMGVFYWWYFLFYENLLTNERERLSLLRIISFLISGALLPPTRAGSCENYSICPKFWPEFSGWELVRIQLFALYLSEYLVFFHIWRFLRDLLIEIYPKMH